MVASNQQFIYALDKKINKKVPHKIKDGFAISLVTGSRFKYISTKKNVQTRRK